MTEPRTEIISTRLSHDELALLQRAADEHGRPLSVYMRDQVLCAELRSRPGARTTRLASGAELTVWTNRPDLLSIA